MSALAQHLYDRWLEAHNGPGSPTIEEFATVELCHLEDDEWTEAVRGAEAIQAKAEGRVVRDSGWRDRLDLLTECAECGNAYPELDLQFGICDSCDNESRGLCACGEYPGPGRRQCEPCAADDHADYLFHADR